MQSSKEDSHPDEPPNLYECTVCLEIVHPQCVEKTVGLGKVNKDLSNSWECAKCTTQSSGTEGGQKRSSEDGEEAPAPTKASKTQA